MLKRKMFRDILRNKSQFITIFLMVLIGVMVYVGIEAYMDGMIETADRFYTNNNLQDINVIGSSFTKDDLESIKSIKHVKDVERKLEFNAINDSDEDISYLVSIIESNNVSKFEVEKGEKFDSQKKGIWIDKYYADENKVSVGDSIKFTYDGYTFDEKILGIVYIPDHIYTVKDASALYPDYRIFGSIYMSYIELEDYIKSEYLEKLSMETGKTITEEMFDKLIPSFKFEDYIPYSYVMVDIDDSKNVNYVKNEIEESIDNALVIIEIEDTASYTMYQGEIDEGGAFVGIFSGLFIFIAMLSVITTMTRVVKKQKLQIGTLKALGFSNFKVSLHYIGYGFWVSLFGAIAGILAGRYFIGNVFYGMEMDFFEIPRLTPIVNPKSYLVAGIVVLITSIITLLTCRKELKKIPAESLRNELPKVKEGSLSITTKSIFKYLGFSSKWNLRDIIRNKFRTITGVVGIVGCCTLIVCALGMLNSINYFIKLQFEDLYNFEYKLVLKENIDEDSIVKLTDKYGEFTSKTLNIEIKDKDGNRDMNSIFVSDANNYVRFVDKKQKFVKLDSDEGLYVTYKYAQTNDLSIGDKVEWHIYGDKEYHESKIIGFYRDPQVQGFTATKGYIESLGIDYKADTIYTNDDLSNSKTIENVDIVQGRQELKDSISEMLSMMRTMIIIIIFFAILLGVIIINNMGVLSFGEKQYQFATLKVLGFSDKRIRKIFTEQTSWISVASIIIGLPAGFYLTSWLFTICLDESYDFGTHIEWWTYLCAAIGTYLASYVVSKILSKKIKNIDMVSSLKANE